MKAHYMDVLTLLLAILGIVTVVILESKHSTESQSSPVAADAEISCWTPAHFSFPWVEYTNSVCKAFWKNGEVYDGPSVVPSPTTSEMVMRNQQPDWKQPSTDEQGEKSQEESNLEKLLLGETIVAIVTFVSLQTVMTLLATRARAFQLSDDEKPDVAEDDKQLKRDSINRNKKVLKQMSRSHSLTIVYCGILLVAAIAWFILAAQSHSVMGDRRGTGEIESVKSSNFTDGDSKTDVFACEFKVRRLGNVQRFSVQCVASIPQPQTVTQGNEGVFAAQMNTALCFTIACLLLIHLLYTLVGAPVLNKLVGGGKIQFVSDVHLFTAVN